MVTRSLDMPAEIGTRDCVGGDAGLAKASALMDQGLTVVSSGKVRSLRPQAVALPLANE